MAAKAKTIPRKKIRARLTREKVLKKAIRQTDKYGITELSMRNLAASLNVEAMSLYNHVQNKDDVLDGMVNLVVEDFLLPRPTKAWKNALKKSAISMHTELLKHPWAAQLLISRVNVSDAMLKNSEAWLRCLHSAGFSYAMADHAWNAVTNHIYGFTLTLINAPIGTENYAKAARQYLPQVPEEDYPHMHGLMQLIVSGEHSGINNFEFGLDLILDGLEKKLDN